MMFPLTVQEQDDTLIVVQKRPAIYYLIWGTGIVFLLLFLLFAVYLNVNTRSFECRRDAEGTPDCFVHEYLFNQHRQTSIIPSVTGIVRSNKQYYITSANGQMLNIKKFGSYIDIQRFLENPSDMGYSYTKKAKMSLPNLMLIVMFMIGCIVGLIKLLQIRSATTIFDYNARKIVFDNGMPTKKIKEIPLSKVGYVTYYKNPSTLSLRLYGAPNFPIANYVLDNQKVPQYIVESAALMNQWLESHGLGERVPPHELDPTVIPAPRRTTR